eukprot:g3453.t1
MEHEHANGEVEEQGEDVTSNGDDVSKEKKGGEGNVFNGEASKKETNIYIERSDIPVVLAVDFDPHVINDAKSIVSSTERRQPKAIGEDAESAEEGDREGGSKEGGSSEDEEAKSANESFSTETLPRSHYFSDERSSEMLSSGGKILGRNADVDETRGGDLAGSDEGAVEEECCDFDLDPDVSLSELVASLKIDVDRLECDYGNARREKLEVDEICRELEARFATQSRQLAALETRAGRSDSIRSALLARVASEQEESSDFARAFERTLQTNHSLRRRVEELEIRNGSLAKELATRDDSVAELERRLDSEREERSRVESDRDTARSVVTRMKSELLEARSKTVKLESFERRAQDMRVEIERLRHLQSDHDFFRQRVRVLEEQVRHHEEAQSQREEKEAFASSRSSAPGCPSRVRKRSTKRMKTTTKCAPKPALSTTGTTAAMMSENIPPSRKISTSQTSAEPPLSTKRTGPISDSATPRSSKRRSSSKESRRPRVASTKTKARRMARRSFLEHKLD